MEAVISVRRLRSSPFKARVTRDGRLIGFVTKRGSQYHPEFTGAPGTHWFPTLTSALRYLVTRTPGEDGHLVVAERGDAIGQVNAAPPSLKDAWAAAGEYLRETRG